MALNVSQGPDDEYRVPGTSNQTGSHAPRPRWPEATTVVIHVIAHHLGYNDDRMNKLGERPDPKEQYLLFAKIMPWFPDWYNARHLAAAEKSGYPIEKLELFPKHGPKKVDNRLLYRFDVPKKGDEPRKYGISGEHPDSPEGRRRGIYVKYSTEIHRRLKLGLTISKQEIDKWSKS